MNIKIAEKIRNSALSEEHYFQSIIEEGIKASMLRDEDIEKIQYEIMKLLEYKVKKYNGPDNSSIRVEMAQTIMESNLYTIGIFLKTFESPDDALEDLKNRKIFDIYIEGRNRIDYIMNSIKELHGDVMKNIPEIKNYIYNATIVDGIKGFIKIYNPDFEAHEIKITADYPVFNSMKKLKGIEFIYEYLKCIYFENVFCSNFSSEDINDLLFRYDEGYEELVINIYELVLSAALASMISKNNIKNLKISFENLDYLYSVFSKKSAVDINKIIIDNFKKFEKDIFFLNSNQKSYVERSILKISENIERAIGLKKLDKLFGVKEYKKHYEKTFISFGEKMDDGKYRKIIEEIIECNRLSDKIEIIIENIRSLADFEDMLMDGEFTKAETMEILKLLNTYEINALKKKYQFVSSLEAADLRTSEYELAMILWKYNLEEN